MRNSEYFMGVQAFTGQGATANNRQETASFGYNVGFNAGLPLYRITCGLVSGQLGLRYAQSNFQDQFFSADNRNQLFFTGGIYRRVDYGLQFGVVADVLRETWISRIELVQMRGELSYVWPAGHTFGFRFARGIQNDTDAQVPADSLDTYRMFYRHACAWGGHSEFFAGWSDESHTVLGADYELPLGECSVLQSGFTYLSPENRNLTIDNEAWNIFLNISFRPRGRGWYKFYHRPLLPVADNGSLMLRRN